MAAGGGAAAGGAGGGRDDGGATMAAMGDQITSGERRSSPVVAAGDSKATVCFRRGGGCGGCGGCSWAGRLGGAEIARTQWYREGQVPLHTLRANIDYGESPAVTTYGVCGVKVWIY